MHCITCHVSLTIRLRIPAGWVCPPCYAKVLHDALPASRLPRLTAGAVAGAGAAATGSGPAVAHRAVDGVSAPERLATAHRSLEAVGVGVPA